MSHLKKSLEYIFSAELEGEPVCKPFGLSAVFKKLTYLSADIFRIVGSTRFKFRNAEMCSLTEEFGVVSLSNAYMWGTPNLSLSGSELPQGVLLQDPVHRDPCEGITLIQKLDEHKRLTPTDYTFASDVREAVAKLNRENLPEKLCGALDLMQSAGYSFSLEGEELRVREIIQLGMPDFSEKVFSLISEDRKFRKSWDSDKYEVVLHSNRPDYILHGRPACSENVKNILSGLHISP